MEYASWTASLPFRSPTRRDNRDVDFAPPASAPSVTLPLIPRLPPRQTEQDSSNEYIGSVQTSPYDAGDELSPEQTPPKQHNIGFLTPPNPWMSALSANDLSHLQSKSPLIIEQDDVFAPQPSNNTDTPEDTKATKATMGPQEEPSRNITHVKSIDFSPRASSGPALEVSPRSITHVADIDFSPPASSPAQMLGSPGSLFVSKRPIIGPPSTPTHQVQRTSVQKRRRKSHTDLDLPRLRLPANTVHEASRTPFSPTSSTASSIALRKTYAPALVGMHPAAAAGRITSTDLTAALRANERRISRSFSEWDMARGLAGKDEIIYKTGARDRLLGICVKAKMGGGVGVKASPSTFLCGWHQLSANSAYTRPVGEMLQEILRVRYPATAGTGVAEGGVVGVRGYERGAVTATGEDVMGGDVQDLVAEDDETTALLGA